jgi:hypothetical protein
MRKIKLQIGRISYADYGMRRRCPKTRGIMMRDRIILSVHHDKRSSLRALRTSGYELSTIRSARDSTAHRAANI